MESLERQVELAQPVSREPREQQVQQVQQEQRAQQGRQAERELLEQQVVHTNLPK